MTHFHYELIAVAEYAAWIFAVGFALWRGDRTARLIAVCHLLGTGVMIVTPSRLVGLVVDLAGLATMCAVAVRVPSSWLLWSCAFQLISTATRVAVLLDDRIKHLAFMTALNTWWMLELAALVWGTVDAMRRRTPRAEAAA